MRRLRLALAIAAVAAAVVLLVWHARSGRSEDLLADLPAGTWTDGAEVGDLRVAFAGGGQVVTQTDAERRMVVEPAVATEPSTTHAALVVSYDDFTSSCLSVSARLNSEEQLRSGSTPNTWEVGWLVWDYADNDHFSYALVKPGGWELGKRDPAYPGGQRFLATGGQVSAPIGSWHVLHVYRRVVDSGDSRLTLHIDGQQVADVVDQERPYTQGRVGIYSEDSRLAASTLTVGSC